MRRVLIILILSLALGTVAAKFTPAWQRDYLVSGDEFTIDAQRNPLEFTLGARGKENQYYEVSADDAQALEQDGKVESSPNLAVESTAPEVRAGPVKWTERRNKRTIHHTAPGFRVSFQAKVRAQAQENGRGELWWTSPTLAQMAAAGDLRLRDGKGRQEGPGKLLLRRFEVFPTAAAKQAALWPDSFKAGVPLGLALAGALIWLFAFPRSKAVPREVSGLPVTFGRRYGGVQYLIGIIGCMVVIIIGLMLGLVTLLQDDHLDIHDTIATGLGFSIFGALYLAIVAYFCLKALREVTLSHDGVEVRTGPAGKLKFQANWQELASVEHLIRRQNNRVASEELKLVAQNGRKIKIGKTHVQDFPLMMEAVYRLHEQSRAGGVQAGMPGLAK